MIHTCLNICIYVTVYDLAMALLFFLLHPWIDQPGAKNPAWQSCPWWSLQIDLTIHSATLGHSSGHLAFARKPLHLHTRRLHYLLYKQFYSFLLEYQTLPKLRFVKIYFATPTFDKITKDRAAKFVDMMSAIGGTMGLLTGFSIISAVEIVYHVVIIFLKMAEKKFV